MIPADEKTKESPPILLFLAAFLALGVAAAVPTVLYLQAKGDAHAAIAGEAEAGASTAMQAEPPSPTVAAPAPPGVVASSAPSVTASVAASAAEAPPSPSSVASADAGAKPDASPKPASADGDGPGFFTINTVPHARVSEHGRVLCTTTPCAHLAMTPGSHTITLENKEEAMKMVIAVTITSGETTSRRVTLKPVP